MKKVININFQGRVIPIEESAHDMLTRYVESLRMFFASEDGRDEIINDIEGRIAELFSEFLKKGNTCITDQEVQTVIAGMGRPEDFEAEEDHVKSQLSGDKAGQQRSYSYAHTTAGAKRLYRDETHKVLGGVCSGIANYFGIDPIFVRILFIIFFGIAFAPYLILWIAVPGSSSVLLGAQRKRLFRDPDSKWLGGVCSGLAQYFSVQLWIPRALFLIPFFSLAFSWGHWGWWDFPHFLSFTFSPGSLVVYAILWILLPEAKTAADRLEMKGERVDLNNIKSTIQGDMEGFKDRAKQFGEELKEKAQEIGDNIGRSTSRMAGEAGAAAKTHRNVFASVVAAILKIFIYFIVGCILFSIVSGLFIAGVMLTGLLPAYSSYVLNDGMQQILAWGTLIFFIWIPVIAIVTWIIRKLTGKKSSSNILSLIFSSLWILGLICFINLLVQLISEFRYRNYPQEETLQLASPQVNKMEIKSVSFGKYYTGSWFKLEPFSTFDEDTAYVQNVRIRIVKATGDSFKVTMVRMSNAADKNQAEKLAANINFKITQKDSLLLFDKGIAINKQDKFRNQQVIVTVAVPVGKRIFINDNIGWGNDVHMDFERGDNYWDWENNLDTHSYNFDHNVDYVMTNTGLERLYKDKNDDNNDTTDEKENKDGRGNEIDQYRKSKEQLQRAKEEKLKELEQLNRELQAPADSTRYHYNQPPAPQPAAQPKKEKSVASAKHTQDIPNGMNDTAAMKYAF